MEFFALGLLQSMAAAMNSMVVFFMMSLVGRGGVDNSGTGMDDLCWLGACVFGLGCIDLGSGDG